MSSERKYTYYKMVDGRILTLLECMNWLRDQEVDEEEPQGVLITPVKLTKAAFRELPIQ